MKNIFILITVSITFITGLTLNSNTHKCDWKDCGHQGELMLESKFKSNWGYEKDTDGYVIELTHFLNPGLTYEDCEL